MRTRLTETVIAAVITIEMITRMVKISFRLAPGTLMVAIGMLPGRRYGITSVKCRAQRQAPRLHHLRLLPPPPPPPPRLHHLRLPHLLPHLLPHPRHG